MYARHIWGQQAKELMIEIHQRRNCRTKSGNRNNRLQRTGYGVNISLNTYAAIQGKKECKLYIYEAIREDAYVLYGFADKQERELFLLLISVSGIGGNTARMILSALSPSELINVISTENATLLKTGQGYRAENSPTDNCGFKRQNQDRQRCSRQRRDHRYTGIGSQRTSNKKKP